MKTTVIIPTYNGAHKILFALRSLESQTRPPDEVVVIIDGSSDHTHALLGNESFSLKDLKIINQENTGRARVRNNGALHATGDLLVFMDDDMVARNNWLQAHVEHHEANPLTILTGSALVPETAADADYQKFKIFLSYKWTARLKQYDRQPLPKDALFLSAANFSIPKLLFTNLNGFDASLNDVEDYDLALRALAQSTLVYYSAAADAWHKETATCAQAIKRTREYNRAANYLLQAKPGLYKEVWGSGKAQVSGLKNLVFRLFCNRTIINSIDKERWTWMPQKFRYKLYDIILTANGTVHPEIVKL